MTPIGRPNRSAGKARPHVVAVSGSRRDGSYTRRALEEALAGSEAAGGTTELLDLADMQLLPLDPDLDAPEDSETVRQTIREADAVLLGTPMYHGSYSGVLKNALDYCGFDEFEDTTVGLLVVSGGPFPTPALDHLRAVCRSLNAWVLPYQAAVPQARTVFNGEGSLTRISESVFGHSVHVPSTTPRSNRDRSRQSRAKRCDSIHDTAHRHAGRGLPLAKR